MSQLSIHSYLQSNKPSSSGSFSLVIHGPWFNVPPIICLCSHPQKRQLLITVSWSHCKSLILQLQVQLLRFSLGTKDFISRRQNGVESLRGTFGQQWARNWGLFPTPLKFVSSLSALRHCLESKFSYLQNRLGIWTLDSFRRPNGKMQTYLYRKHLG